MRFVDGSIKIQARKCPTCGKEFPVTETTCPEDGATLDLIDVFEGDVHPASLNASPTRPGEQIAKAVSSWAEEEEAIGDKSTVSRLYDVDTATVSDGATPAGSDEALLGGKTPLVPPAAVDVAAQTASGEFVSRVGPMPKMPSLAQYEKTAEPPDERGSRLQWLYVIGVALGAFALGGAVVYWVLSPERNASKVGSPIPTSAAATGKEAAPGRSSNPLHIVPPLKPAPLTRERVKGGSSEPKIEPDANAPETIAATEPEVVEPEPQAEAQAAAESPEEVRPAPRRTRKRSDRRRRRPRTRSSRGNTKESSSPGQKQGGITVDPFAD